MAMNRVTLSSNFMGARGNSRHLYFFTSSTAKNENRVAVNCDGAIGSLHADPMRLRQALLNLMSNANKFTERGTITVHARHGQENGRGWVTISVADTGIGMSPFPRMGPRRRISTAGVSRLAQWFAV
jgi:signal transduction histidine kinase